MKISNLTGKLVVKKRLYDPESGKTSYLCKIGNHDCVTNPHHLFSTTIRNYHLEDVKAVLVNEPSGKIYIDSLSIVEEEKLRIRKFWL